jgi:integrase
LKEYASPFIGNMDVADIGVDDVMRVLDPIWHKVPETASRVRMRIENVLGWATAMNHRKGFNPAVWRGNLSHLLPDKQKIAPVQHFKAIPYKDMPALYAELLAKTSLSAKALRFTMLNACRTGETIGAEWAEFEDGVWEIPAERMKMGSAHAVPLSGEVASVLDELDDSGQYLFPALKGKGHMSNIAMLKALKEMRPGFTVHGFRSGFRDWAAEKTNYQNHIAEMALAHSVKGVEASYRRGDLLEKRAALMNDWANFLLQK